MAEPELQLGDLPIFYAPDIASCDQLPESEAGHCIRVLRCQCGDRVLVADGRGVMYLCDIVEIKGKSCRVSITQSLPWPRSWQGCITLALAPTKAIERMEWLLEKAVEVGVDRIILLKTKHSERKYINTERLQRIMLSAMKQSQKAVLPELITELRLEQALEMSAGVQRLILHCRDDEQTLRPRELPHRHYQGVGDVCLFIGPEGDFTVEEIRVAEDAGLLPTTLGNTRLRTETAALAALQWVHTLQLMTQES